MKEIAATGEEEASLMAKPLVTILMPTYRRPGYLRQALRAAVGQTYQNLQIIVRDNSSGDDTPEIVKQFQDPRIEFCQSSYTVDPAANGAECLRRAKGKYCMTLADDDRIEANYIEILAQALEKGDDIAIAYAGGIFLDDKGEVIGRKIPVGSYAMETMPFLMAWARNELPLATPASMLMRVDWIREVTAELQNDRFIEGHNADNAFMIWVALRGKVFFTDKTAYSYRVHGGNTAMRLTSRQNLDGDRALLEFIEAERQGSFGERLSANEWRTFKAAAVELLAGTYFWRVTTRNLECYGLAAGITALGLRPALVFGPVVTAKMLLSKRSELKSWLRGKLKCLRQEDGRSSTRKLGTDSFRSNEL